MKIEDLIDSQSIQRLTCAAMEFLVVAAITSLNLTAVVKMIGPLSLLVLLGFLWCGICLLVIGRYLLPKDYWFELGLINYGMSTGVTATGFVLLRIVDKDLDSGAAEDYALAAPLSAPFIGGGILTFTLPVIMQKYGAGWPFAALCLALLLFGAAGVLLTRPSNSRK